MLLHFVNDEKFIDGFIEDQNKHVPNNKNVYFAWSKGKKQLKHIKNKEVVLKDDNSYREILNYINKEKPSKIFFHNLNKSNWKIINNIPNGIIICWIFYGSEIFNRKENIHLFTGPLTNAFLNQRSKVALRNLSSRFLFYLESLTYKLFKWKFTEFYRVISRIDQMAHWIKDDFDFVKKRYNLEKIEYVNFCYVNKAFEIKCINNRENLLIGNSGSDTNNHLDIFSIIPEHFIEKFNKIIIPLSYSGKELYINKVKIAAKQRFGEKALILDDFMVKEEYFKLLATVKLAIMGHFRSQGGGNVRFFLKNRIDVMMFENNNLFKFLTKSKAKIHSLDSLSQNFYFFSPKELEQNMLVQKSLFEGEKVKEYYESLLR